MKKNRIINIMVFQKTIALLLCTIIFIELVSVTANAAQTDDLILNEYQYHSTLYYNATDPYSYVYGNEKYAYKCYISPKAGFEYTFYPIMFVYNGKIVRNADVNEDLFKIYFAQYGKMRPYFTDLLSNAQDFIDITKAVKFGDIVEDASSFAVKSLATIGSVYLSGGTVSTSVISKIVEEQTLDELKEHILDVSQIITDAQLGYFYATVAEMESTISKLNSIKDFTSFRNCEMYFDYAEDLVKAKACAARLISLITVDLKDKDTFFKAFANLVLDAASGFVGGFCECMKYAGKLAEMQKNPNLLAKIIMFAGEIAECDQAIGEYQGVLMSIAQSDVGSLFSIVEAYNVRDQVVTPMMLLKAANKIALEQHPDDTGSSDDTNTDIGETEKPMLVTETEFAQKIMSLKKKYPDGKYWNQYNGTENLAGISISVAKAGDNLCKKGYNGVNCTSRGYCHPSCSCSCGQFPVNGSGQCFGFANLMAYHIFGSYVTTGYSKSNMNTSKGWTYLTSVNTFYAGDFVVIDNKAHTIFVYKVTDSTVYYVDCNASGPCQIDWDKSISINSLKNTTTLVGRMSGNTLKGTVSTTNLLTMTFNANGGSIPANHSYKVTTPNSVLRLRSEPSLSATNLTQIPNGKTFNATATATADGYTWAKTTYGGYTGWCAVSGGLAARLGYYVQTDSIYQYSDMKIFTQKWKQGTGSSGGLTDYDTFKLYRDGYTFMGWSLSKDGSTTIFDQNDKTLKAEDIYPDVKNGDQTVTLYAIWKSNTPASLTFQYNANGGTGTMAASTASQGSTLVLMNNSFIRTGYELLGWNIQRQDGLWYADNGAWCTEDVLSSKGYGKALLQNGASLALTSSFVTMSGNHSYTLYAVWRDTSIQTIYVESIPQKAMYYVSDSVNTSDLVLAVKYKDGSFATVTEGFTCSPVTCSAEGIQTVTVTYQGVSTAYSVPVTAVKTFKKNAVASAEKDCYLLPNTSAEKFLYLWAKDELAILCKDGDFYLGFYPWRSTKITEANGVLAYIPVSAVTLNSGVIVPDASSYYSINRSGTVITSAKVYHRTNTSSVVTTSNVDKTVIATLNAGTTVKVLFEMNGYYCIQTSSYTGFVAKSAIALNPTLCGIECNVGSMSATVGDAINTSRVRVEAVYSDGSTVAVTDYSLSLPSTDTAGTKYAMIHYGGFVTYFFVEISSPVITNIFIQTPPAKDKYIVGESFESAGMTVQAVYENGTIENISLSSLQYQYNFAEPGYTTVRVEYMGQYAEVMALVYTPPVFAIGDTTGYIGENVSVPVLCKSDEMYIDGYSLTMTLTYDTTALQYCGFTASDYIEGTRLVVNSSEAGKLVIAYAHHSSIPLNAPLMELHFTVIAENAENTQHGIQISGCEFYDCNSMPYTLRCENGAITNLGYVEVEYRAKESVAVPQPESVKYGQQIVVSNSVPVRQGYTFLGWSLIPDSDSIDYKPGDTIDCLYSFTLYAVWEEKFVEQWGLVLEDDLRVGFHLNVDSSISASARIRISCGEQVHEYSVSELPMLEQGEYLLTVNVAPAEMMKEIVVQLMDNNTIIKEATHTVREYCDTILADSTYSQYHALVKEMLNYGAMAQMYFDYDAEYLANDGITGVANAEVPETVDEMTISGKINGVNFYGASLVYRDRIAVRYYFTGDVTGCTFIANGSSYSPVAKDGMYYVEIADILPQDLDQQITLTVTDANGNTLSVTYGPMNYIVRMNEKGSDALKALVKALYNYHLASKALTA